jgi:hypothetical protein
MTIELDYGLELTNNSKVGWAFSLPRHKSCIDATAICKRLCYGNGIRYQSVSQKDKRERNYKTAEFLLSHGGPTLLAENLLMTVDLARPRDWLTAKITNTTTVVPWTLRIHDIGDFYSVDYVNAWFSVIQNRPECSFWFYTRSFINQEMFTALTRLASLQNCQGWLSVDSDNYEKAILAKCTAAEIWKLALLQDKDLPQEVLPRLRESVGASEIVSFPYHRSGHHVVPLRDKVLTVCPAVTGFYELQSDKNAPRPCQLCTFCLP